MSCQIAAESIPKDRESIPKNSESICARHLRDGAARPSAAPTQFGRAAQLDRASVPSLKAGDSSSSAIAIYRRTCRARFARLGEVFDVLGNRAKAAAMHVRRLIWIDLRANLSRDAEVLPIRDGRAIFELPGRYPW